MPLVLGLKWPGGKVVAKMADYAIRVELQGYPTREEYEALHALMAQKGFYQSVSG